MDASRFGPGLRALLGAARAIAERRGQPRLEPEHLLAAAAAPGGEIAAVCDRLGLAVGSLRDEAAQLVEALPPGPGAVEAGEALVELLAASAREAWAGGAGEIEVPHVLLALSQAPRAEAGRALRRAGLSRGRLAARDGTTTPLPARTPSAPTPTLDRCGRDLTALAREGRLDPVAGRERELRRLVEVLGRRSKANPVLVGEPGVGKTAIVEGLAVRIAAGGVPRHLAGRRLVQLDLGALVAGSRYRGEFEERVEALLRELSRAPEVLLFIDEIHLLAGVGAGDGALDGASLLKPALGRGELRLVGATTVEEWRRRVERDGALERRLVPIRVDEPDEARAMVMLRALRRRYEEHHGVRFGDDALEAAVRLGRRHVPGRALPDKAIDALDEAAARLRAEREAGPPELDELRAALASEPGDEGDLRAGALRSALAALTAHHERARDAPPTVDEEAVARVIADWTGLPVARLARGEQRRIERLEERLRARVVGQPEATARVAAAVRRSRAGLADPRRPVGSFLFLGPTGVGKTELARALAEELFADERALVRLDMSEFMERHCAARLVGAPPGYLGHDDGGQLTEAVRRRPWAVVLFDEIDKAHREVRDLLLQILDDGRLTDGRGRTVSFRDAVIVLTANTAVEEHLRPELIGRLDEVVRFRPLDGATVAEVAELHLDRVRRVAAERGLSLRFDDTATARVAAAGFHPALGARPLRGAIQRLVLDPLAERIVAGELHAGLRVAVHAVGDELRFVAWPSAGLAPETDSDRESLRKK